MTFGDNLLLNKRWRFGYVLLLNIRWQFSDTQLLCFCGRFCDNLSLSINWQFWRPLIAETETIELVAFIRLEGVNYVSHMFPLIIFTTFLF
jgi:hypothetical protein